MVWYGEMKMVNGRQRIRKIENEEEEEGERDDDGDERNSTR